MTWERGWVLLFAPLVIWFLVEEWPRAKSRIGLVLKTATLLAILLALAEPQITVNETKMAVAVLVDTSDSVSQQDLRRASRLISQIEKARGRHWVRVIPFARTARPLAPSERGPEWNLKPTAGEAAKATNLEAAIRDGAASLPAGLIGRLVLISDGKENQGSAARAAWQARQLGLPIDTYLLQGRPKPSLRIESLSFPSVAFTGERFPIDLVVSAPKAIAAVIELWAEGRQLGSHPVELGAGENAVRIFTSLSAAGAFNLAGVIRTQQGDEVRFEQAISVRQPRVLFVSQDPPEVDSHLLAVLEAGKFQVDRVENASSSRFSAYQIVVFNNHNLETIPANKKLELETFVKEGGGLLVIGGEQNLFVEGKKEEDPLERALPAKLAPPRSPEGTMVVLIIDKSSSMEGRKMELARTAAIGVIENLRPVDLVGVLIFDNSFQWAVPIRKAEDRATIKRLVAGITPDGGTQIAPALSEAFRRSIPVRATFKHIVLLTDGISEEGDSLAVAREAANERITISTVGLGQDVNRAYLEKVAQFAKGKSYFLNDPSGLAQILLKDVMEHTGSTAIEKPILPVVTKNSEILAGVEIASAPPLKGYVKFISKPTADTILSVEGRDPLLARWQYGLGRAMVFTSDAKNRWAADWVVWKSFDKFWANLFRDLLPHSQPGEARLDFDASSGELVADYRLGARLPEPATVPQLYVFGPNGFQQALELRKMAPGVFRGKVAIGNRRGLFRVRPLAESEAFPEIGHYRPEDEMNDYGADELLLKQLSSFTGGRFQPKPEDVFTAPGPGKPASLRLWPGLLGAALALNLLELVLRKWKGLLLSFRPQAA
ncbi:MAG: VWA domain-containing protein [Bryobacteraceae bacterium]|nr:VWA domain-containing protein [Bryobacteraceae bacterium]MDW8379085.1 VWA domain-containing protein [Bryobacterales bacterium]